MASSEHPNGTGNVVKSPKAGHSVKAEVIVAETAVGTTTPVNSPGGPSTAKTSTVATTAGGAENGTDKGGASAQTDAAAAAAKKEEHKNIGCFTVGK